MKKLLLAALILFSLALCIRALCDPQRLFVAYEVNDVRCPNDVIRKNEKWVAYFPGYNSATGYGVKEADPFGYGWCQSDGNQCWPDFNIATITHGRDLQGRQTWKWEKITYDKNLYCQRTDSHTATMDYTCPSQLAESCTTPGFNGTCPPSTSPDAYGMCCTTLAGVGGDTCPDPPESFQAGHILPETNCPYAIYDFATRYSPVLIDIAGDGFRLTGAAEGVRFDIDGNPDGLAEQVSWTVPDSDDAFRSAGSFLDSHT